MMKDMGKKKKVTTRPGLDEENTGILDFRSVFDSIPGLYIVLFPDKNFTIAWANKHFLTAFGKRIEEAKDSSLNEILNPAGHDYNKQPLLELHNALHWVVKNKQGYMLLQKYNETKTANGVEELQVRHWEILAAPSFLKNGNVQYIIIRFTDAAAMIRSKEREEKQQQHTRALEELKRENMRRIKESKEQLEVLNESLGKSIAELELANDELDAFCSSVSHDLHAPLRVISGYVNILLDEHSARLTKDAQKMLDRVFANASAMSRQIDDLLAFSRMGKESIKPAELNMTDIAKKSLGMVLAGKPASIKPRISLDKLLPANADRNMMGHVFTNLLSNAVKYSSKNKHPEIEIKSVALKGRTVYSVKDNGAGFDMKYADRLFGIFQRLHSKEEYEGTGLGLALVKRIITRHGGKVWAKSKPGRGAVFYFSLSASK